MAGIIGANGKLNEGFNVSSVEAFEREECRLLVFVFVALLFFRFGFVQEAAAA